MKYVIALVASAAVIVFWAMLSVAVGWKHGGGFVGMIFMWSIVAGIWGVIMTKFPDTPAPTNTSHATQHTPPRAIGSVISRNMGIPPDQPIDDKPYYAQAMTECQENASGRDAGLWAKAFSLSSGDPLHTQAKYIELRVYDLVRTEQTQREAIRLSDSEQARKSMNAPDYADSDSLIDQAPTALRWEGGTCIRWAMIIQPEQLTIVNRTTSERLIVERSTALTRVKVSPSGWTNKNIVVRHNDGRTYAFAADTALSKSVLKWLNQAAVASTHS